MLLLAFYLVLMKIGHWRMQPRSWQTRRASGKGGENLENFEVEALAKTRWREEEHDAKQLDSIDASGALSQQVLSCLRHLVPGGGSSLVVATRSRRCHHTKRRTRRLQG
jgi:hypothetical protein